ncbi:DsbA family protein [Pseudogemmobacter sp. W21_MBD1_M6]|uniref:DsbA family protein n=1 Tax=Pseudogemmobacter sp. W21_MBD1_M6 TaxID=3240271 RepID=UPI003F99FB66
MQRRTALSTLAVVLAGGAAYIAFPRTDGLPTMSSAEAQVATADTDTSAVMDMAMGDANAPVTVIEYASFTCPHCARFHFDVFGELKKNYIDTGKIRFIYREVYFDRFGLWASMIARSGGEMRYFGIIEMIYDTQKEWTGSNDPAVIADNLRRIGRSAGLTDEQMNAALNDAAQAETLVVWYQKNAEADGIESTPSFVVDGTKYSNMGYAEFSKLIDEKLAAK